MRRSIVFDLSHSAGMLFSNPGLVDATMSRVSHVADGEGRLPDLQARAQVRAQSCAGSLV